jgi:hypothetical protein
MPVRYQNPGEQDVKRSPNDKGQMTNQVQNPNDN